MTALIGEILVEEMFLQKTEYIIEVINLIWAENLSSTQECPKSKETAQQPIDNHE